MKRSIVSLILTCTIAAIGAPALAQYTGPSADLRTTVEKAKTMRDDTNVTLQGKIVQSLGGEKYLFRDSTGDIVIEIDHDKWMGLAVSDKDVVTIYGEVDKDWNSIEIDVDRISK